MSSSSRDLLLLKCQSTIQALHTEIELLTRKNKELILSNNELQENLQREENLNRNESSWRKGEEVRDLRVKYKKLLAEAEQTTEKFIEMQKQMKDKEKEYALNVKRNKKKK